MFHVDMYRGGAGLAALARDWNLLSENLRHERFFHYHGWWKSYLSALDREPDTVSVFVVRRDDQPVAIIPLKRSRRRWFGLNVRQWVLPEHSHLPLSDILCSREVGVAEVIAALADALRQDGAGGWDVLGFTGVLEESPLAEFVTQARCRAVSSLLKTCDYLACSGAYEDITAKFSRNFRSNLTKARNKLAREKEVEFRSVIEQPDLDRCFAEFVEIEGSGWKGKRGTGTAIKLHPDLMQFYQSLIDELGADGAVMINSLKVSDKPIASQFCVKDDDTLYVLKLAYDEDWSHVAPGNMLLERVIEKGIQEKEFRYLNLVGAPPWFKDWRPESQRVYSIRLFNATPVGLALFGLMKTKERLKPLYHKWMKRVRITRKPPRTRPE